MAKIALFPFGAHVPQVVLIAVITVVLAVFLEPFHDVGIMFDRLVDASVILVQKHVLA